MRIEFQPEPKLYTESALSSFLSIPPRDPEGWSLSVKRIRHQDFCRNELSDVLLRYNQSLGNDEASFGKIRRLADPDAYCVFTGQQLGLMGGPAYTILKAITCILVAREHNAVPIFWLATEDHDVDEIDQTYLLDPYGNLKKYHLALPKDGSFVEDLAVQPHHLEVIRSFLEAADCEEMFEELSNESSYSKLMARLLVRLFRGTGLIFLEPYLLRPFAKRFFMKELEDSSEIARILGETTAGLVQDGGEAPLKVGTGTNLFFKHKGKYRVKIEETKDGFAIGSSRYTKEEMLACVEESPQFFSASAAARPVLQGWLFPTAAYIAGPSELAYYRQLKEYYAFHGVNMPWVIPRISATILPPKASRMLNDCMLKPWESIPDHWLEVFPSIGEGVEGVANEWMRSCSKYFGQELPAQRLSRFVRNSAQHLERKVTMLRLKQRGIPYHTLHYLNNLIHPHQKLQERVLNWFEFQGQTRGNLISDLLSSVDWRVDGHHYCFL